MRHLTFRLPEYLYQELKSFAEPKAMSLSESVRFMVSEYLKNKYDSDNILKKLNAIEEKIGSLENSERDYDFDRIKKALVILGSDSSRTKLPITNLFPEL